jgi:hypothetical protein
VVKWSIEGIKAVEFGFDLWSICECEAEAAEDLNCAILDDSEGVEGSNREFAGRHGDINSFDGGGVSGVLEFLFASFEGEGDCLSGGV